MLQLKELSLRFTTILFGICLVALFFIGGFLQHHLGVYGLVMTELMILAFAVLPLAMSKSKVSFKEVFPMAVPKVKDVLGSLLVWFGTYSVVLVVASLTAVFFPQMLKVNSEISDFFKQTPMILLIFSGAFMPALCEEMLHRGLIQYSLRQFKYGQIVMIMALFFGVFHLDVYRFLPTALLGIALTIVMLETKNLILPMMIHFVNNALSLGPIGLPKATDLLHMPAEILWQGVGASLILASMSPYLFLLGFKFFRGKAFRIGFKRGAIPVGLSLVMLVSGAVTFYESTMNNEPLINMALVTLVNSDTEPYEEKFVVVRDKVYQHETYIKTEGCTVDLEIVDEDGNVAYGFWAEDLVGNGPLPLKPGNYVLRLTYTLDAWQTGDGSVKFNMKIW